MGQYVHVSATLNKDLLDKVKKFCGREERSKSWVISKAVEEYLNGVEDIEIAYERMAGPKLITSKQLRKRLNV